MNLNSKAIAGNLIDWYDRNGRELPWRRDTDPYRVWISEVMLQQTTVKAVIPYYERFMRRFPTLADLAAAPESDVIAHWAGLGYYSRARNLHRAAKELAKEKKFPRSYRQLLEYAGFGPYTARAVASISFNEAVGVVDGNVIRILCRLYDKDCNWWENRHRDDLQQIADTLVQNVSSGKLNQAMMDLGATVCTPKSPLCSLCPVQEQCQAHREGTSELRPKKKPRREREIWLLTFDVNHRRNRVFVCPNDYAPFLKGSLMLPGEARKVQTKPKTFDFRHSITHHDIYVRVQKRRIQNEKIQRHGKWISLEKISSEVPVSLVRKALDVAFTDPASGRLLANGDQRG